MKMSDTDKKDREQFGSRLAFYFAAVGSAVGFGNVWRFPSLAYKYGGGAFFVPYILALVFIGLPVLFLEIGLGQFFQRGDVTVFAVCHKRMRGVGICSIVCGYITLTYYSMLLTWTTRALFESGNPSIAWNTDGATTENATDYFFNDIIGMATIGEDMLPTRLVGENVGYSLLIQVLIFLCIGFGLKITGMITYVTMGLPIIFLFIFLFLGISLEGSSDGIKQYIGQWDMSTLSGEAWSTAVTQIFFSLSLTFGIMTSYGSHMPRSEPAFLNSCVVAAANSMFSFIAGFAVFSIVGHQAFLLGKPVSELSNSGFGLVFGTWPLVLSQLPGGIHWVRLLFIFLILLGMDSAFSFQEAVLTCLRDTEILKGVAKWKVALSITVLCWGLSLIHATDAGLFFLDTIDFYINFIMLFIGFIESFAVGWVWGIEEQIEKYGSKAVFAYMFANFGSVLVACGFWFGVNVWSGFVALAVVYILFLGLTIGFLSIGTELSAPLRSKLLDLSFGNIFDFKKKAQPVIKYVPTIWCLLIKQVIPHVLLFLFINLAQSKTGSGKSNFGNYSEYPAQPYQVLGILSFVFAAVLFIAGIFFPVVYEALDTREDFGDDGEVKPVFPVEAPVAEA